MYLHKATQNNYRFRKQQLENILQSWQHCPHGHPLFYGAIQRCALLVLGHIGADVACLVALRSLPGHMGSSYLARLTGY